MVRRPEPGRESGQSTIEGAIGLLLISLMFVGILGLVICVYGVNAMNAAIQDASWEIDAAGMELAADKDAFVKDALSAKVAGVNAADLTVRNASIDVEGGERTVGTADKGPVTGLYMTQETKVATVSFDVAYKPPMALGLSVSRHVEHDLLLSREVEVGR